MTNIETDIVVVGFGISGLTAALSAVDAGARVVVLEKRHGASHGRAMTFGRLAALHAASQGGGTRAILVPV